MRVAWSVVLACATLSGVAGAQIDARAVADVVAQSSLHPFGVAGSARIPTLVALPAGQDAQSLGLVPVAPGYAALFASPDALTTFAASHPDLRVTWAPPRRPLLDKVDGWIGGSAFRNATGETGKGAVVGIVDTGVDVSHPDLRTADGHTRIAWLIDLSRAPAGLHPDLEATYGCNAPDFRCAVYDAADIDRLLADGIIGDDPDDAFGHGTHVASLAAGNGLGSATPRFIGVAPEASLVVARVTRDGSGNIYDSDILLGTRFVFDRAAALGQPAVTNLSLGNDFGPHDGSSPLEQALAAYVGPTHPGRAIVVAAGNSAGVYRDVSRDYPAPFGIHTEVHVPRRSSTRVPLLSPRTPGLTTSATVYVWIAFRPGDSVSVGLDRQDGAWIAPLDPGHSAGYKSGDITVSIFNGVTGSDSPLTGSNGAVVVLDGKWSSGSVFALRLEGHGTADLWVQSTGDLDPAAGSAGALFPRAEKEGTIGVPASSPGLIAVGATLNRTSWIDRAGEGVKVPTFGALTDPPLDSIAYFSGAGPAVDGAMKPDILAPGAFVVGAMAHLADPSTNPSSIFAGGSMCKNGSQCLVVDDHHAVTSGTSMATPVVSGAVALLLALDPALTQDRIRTLLQAGARRLAGSAPLEPQLGPGALDLPGTLDVLRAQQTPIAREPAASASWVGLASTYAHPDPDWPLVGVLELRAADGSIADGFDAARLKLMVAPAHITTPLTRVAPGLWRFAAAAPAGSGGGELRLDVTWDDQVLIERKLPIAVDRWIASDGVDARGGCNVAGRNSPWSAIGAVVALALGTLLRRRR